MKKVISSLFAVMLIAGATVWATEPQLEGVKCVVAPKAANAEKSVDYKDGKVFFCCGGCQGKFTASPEKFAPKANHQLVATKQYKQAACPLTGRDVNSSAVVTVGGVEVAFCCNGCKGKVAGAEGAAQVKLVFGEKPFKSGFKVVKASE